MDKPSKTIPKTVLWVDLLISSGDPTTKHLISSIPHLIDAGWQITVWCQTTDITDARVKIVRIPKLPLPLFFNLIWFSFYTLLKAAFQRVKGQASMASVIHTSGGHCLFANVSSFHFINHLWVKKQLELGFDSWRDFIKWVLHSYGMLEDWVQFKNPFCRVYLGVSTSITEEIRQCVHRGARVEVLPNSYDETRFNPEIRTRWRPEMRKLIGFAENEFVFIFVSQGHYRRKGFWLAVAALDILRKDSSKPFRFLVVGGQPKTLAELQNALSEKYPDWPKWITFAGSQWEMEKYYAAADAFLFPSYFEAFCLAEIEAAAMGLPLLLTPHAGTEMILKDGENGVLLPWEASEISEILEKLITHPPIGFAVSPGQALPVRAYAGKLITLYNQLCSDSATRHG